MNVDDLVLPYLGTRLNTFCRFLTYIKSNSHCTSVARNVFFSKFVCLSSEKSEWKKTAKKKELLLDYNITKYLHKIKKTSGRSLLYIYISKRCNYLIHSRY